MLGDVPDLVIDVSPAAEANNLNAFAQRGESVPSGGVAVECRCHLGIGKLCRGFLGKCAKPASARISGCTLSTEQRHRNIKLTGDT